MMLVLAQWRVFMEPMPAHGYEWLLLVPMVVLLSLAYKAVRCEKMERYWKSSALMSLVVIGALAVLTFVGWGLVELMAMLPASG
ncbi:MAG: hypothetical protein Phyf2KO_25800 [Phycisphaerales bacterium]